MYYIFEMSQTKYAQEIKTINIIENMFFKLNLR